MRKNAPRFLDELFYAAFCCLLGCDAGASFASAVSARAKPQPLAMIGFKSSTVIGVQTHARGCLKFAPARGRQAAIQLEDMRTFGIARGTTARLAKRAAESTQDSRVPIFDCVHWDRAKLHEHVPPKRVVLSHKFQGLTPSVQYFVVHEFST